MADIENVIIIGSGPAGYTAALYTSRANLNPLVIEGFMWGGLLQQTTEVENYPGFPGGGIEGPALMTKMREQAEDFGTRFLTDQATSVKLADEPGGIHEVHVGKDVYKSRTVILSMGAEHKKLGVPGEAELAGAGISYCATCDAAFFKDQVIMVVGGGDSALEEAMFLAKFGRKVLLVHRRDEFRASKIMESRARAMENIEFKTPFVVEEFHAGDGPFKRIATLKKTGSDETEEVEIGGAFIAIGHEPQSEIVDGVIAVDDEGYVKVDGRSTRTNIPGVFAAGDLVDHTYRQAITAAGSGCQAALDAEWYLRDTPQIETPPSLAEGDLAEAQWGPAVETPAS
jgi:thioredoxin reductase (NADPH)